MHNSEFTLTIDKLTIAWYSKFQIFTIVVVLEKMKGLVE